MLSRHLGRSHLLGLEGFRNLWLGQAISQLGDALYYVVFMFMVKKVTGSTAMVGYVGVAETVPYLLFGPYAGVIADRWDRRRIMLLSDVLSGSILVGMGAVIALTGSAPVWLIFVAAFGLSSVRCFFMPAKNAAIPNLVPTDMLTKANALSLSTQNIMFMASLSLTATILGALYNTSPQSFYSIAMIGNAASFFGSAWFIARLPRLVPDRGEEEEKHPLHDFVEGLRFVGRRRDLGVLFAVLTVFRLMVAPFFVVYIAANEQWFGGRPESIAWFEFAFFAGMVLGSALVARRSPKRAGAAFVIGLALVGGTIIAMAFTPWFLPFCGWNFIAGLVVPFADIPIMTYMQATIPDDFRGRVNSAMNTLSVGVMPIGAGLGGLLVEKAGVQMAFLVMGVGMGAACLAGLLDREFRHARIPEADVEKGNACPSAVSGELAAEAG